MTSYMKDLPTSQVTPGPPLNGQRSILDFNEFLPIKPTCNKEWYKINLFVDQGRRKRMGQVTPGSPLND